MHSRCRERVGSAAAKTIEVKASHVSMISHPDEIARLIMEAAQRA